MTCDWSLTLPLGSVGPDMFCVVDRGPVDVEIPFGPDPGVVGEEAAYGAARADIALAGHHDAALDLDIAIDQGGCFEDSRPTTHDDPTFRVHDTVFYCVANMPGAVPSTSTYALTNATMPYVLKLADKGWRDACRADPALAKGLSTHEGALLSEQVAADLDLPFTDPADALR